MNLKSCLSARSAALLGLASLFLATNVSAQKVENRALTISVNSQDGSYSVGTRGGQTNFTSRTAVQLEHQWTHSSDYPRHEISESKFSD
ncbi:MAG: hypothetical protein JO260_08695, partial [Acidobacteria bacterium]|nr:hypothetical protein [Acidobacteriota bacterium]